MVVDNYDLDQTGAVIDASRKGEVLPIGQIRVTADILNTATSPTTNGIELRGSSMRGTVLYADYAPADLDRSALIRVDTAGVGNYTYGGTIEKLSLRMAPGREAAAINGINLTAAWMMKVRQVDIYGMRHGVYTPLRPDLSAVSDNYQNFDLLFEQNFIRGSNGHGYNLVAGQSPAMVKIIGGQSILNLGNGVNITSGQFLFDGLIASYNHGSGIAVSSREGPSRLSEIIRCEIQDNQQYNVSLSQIEGLVLHWNNLMSETYSAATGGSPQNNTAFMRPIAHVYLDSGIRGFLAEGNKHRSAGNPIAASNTVYGYLAAANALDANFPSRFIHNDFGLWPPNGLSGNSTGFQKFGGFGAATPGVAIIDP